MMDAEHDPIYNLIKKDDTYERAPQGEIRLNAVRGEGDGRKALESIHGSAARGDAHSQARLGRMYLDGAGVDQDYDLALEWNRKSAAQGNGEALACLGHMYEKGLGVDQDMQKAWTFYKKSAAQGSVLGLVRLGDLYLNGSGVEQSFRKALARYQRAAEQVDDPENAGLALYKLGTMYYQGRGVEKDLRKGFELYERSAKLGNAEAQLCLGAIYRDGMGVGRDHKKALEWFKKSARNNKSQAADSAMGDIYRDGLLVEKNIPEAIRWYEKASEKGDKYARTELVKFKQEAGIKQVFKTNLALAGTGDPKAMAEVADMYLAGMGVGKNEEKACEWFEKAFASGNVSVRSRMQQVQRSIVSKSRMENSTPERISPRAVPGLKRQTKKAQALRRRPYLFFATGITALLFIIILFSFRNKPEQAPGGREPELPASASPPRPQFLSLPSPVPGLPAEIPGKIAARKASRKPSVAGSAPILETMPALAKIEPVVPRLRREYRTLDEQTISAMLAAKNIFDARRNPAGNFPHQYEAVRVAGLRLILDRASDLVWTRQQNLVRMNLKKSIRWIESLNGIEYGGIRDWRLPTLEEAASLLCQGTEAGKIFLDEVFGGDVREIWTGDGFTESESWSIDFLGGAVKPVKNKSRLMILMVSSAAGSLDRNKPDQETPAADDPAKMLDDQDGPNRGGV
jgi:TPR repeat protein